MTLDCRRCGGNRLIRLDKRAREDNDVYRCGECGYIFSPSGPGPSRPGPIPTVSGERRRPHDDARG